MLTSCTQILIYDKILNRLIPENGRHITRREVKLLKAQGVGCSVKWEVYRKGSTPTVGILFEAGVSTGIEVRVKLGRFEKYSI